MMQRTRPNARLETLCISCPNEVLPPAQTHKLLASHSSHYSRARTNAAVGPLLCFRDMHCSDARSRRDMRQSPTSLIVLVPALPDHFRQNAWFRSDWRGVFSRNEPVHGLNSCFTARGVPTDGESQLLYRAGPPIKNANDRPRMGRRTSLANGRPHFAV